MKNFILACLIFTFIIVFFSCQKTDLLSSTEQISQIDIHFNGLNALGDSAWYECWLMWAEGEGDNLKKYYESIGLLTNNAGTEYSISVNVNLGYIQKMLHIVTTIEKDEVPGYRVTVTPTSIDSAKGPGIYKIIAAKIAANSGVFNLGNEQILDFNFETAQARYILNTPTDTSDTNLKRGIWFVNLDTIFTEIKDTSGVVIEIDTVVSRTSGLELPELPENWFYEGWAIFGNDTVSTGRFIKPAGQDSSLNYGAGLANGYNFPGEDFINNPPQGVTFPADLSGTEVLITIKPPYPVNAYKPFTLIPFKTMIPANSQSEKVYTMQNNAASFPSGNVSISVSLYD